MNHSLGKWGNIYKFVSRLLNTQGLLSQRFWGKLCVFLALLNCLKEVTGSILISWVEFAISPCVCVAFFNVLQLHSSFPKPTGLLKGSGETFDGPLMLILFSVQLFYGCQKDRHMAEKCFSARRRRFIRSCLSHSHVGAQRNLNNVLFCFHCAAAQSELLSSGKCAREQIDKEGQTKSKVTVTR